MWSRAGRPEGRPYEFKDRRNRRFLVAFVRTLPSTSLGAGPSFAPVLRQGRPFVHSGQAGRASIGSIWILTLCVTIKKIQTDPLAAGGMTGKNTQAEACLRQAGLCHAKRRRVPASPKSAKRTARTPKRRQQVPHTAEVRPVPFARRSRLARNDSRSEGAGDATRGAARLDPTLRTKRSGWGTRRSKQRPYENEAQSFVA